MHESFSTEITHDPISKVYDVGVEGPSTSSIAAGFMGAARAAVLIVEDDEELRDWVSMELTRHGFSVESAPNGRMALDAQKRRRFDLAVVDLRLPGMNGIETVVALKQRDPDIEAVVATGHATVPDAVGAMKSGAYDFIQKPYTLRQLLPLLEKALEKSHLQGLIAVHEATKPLLGTHGFEELLQQACITLQRLLRVSTVALQLHQPERRIVFPEAGPQPPEELLRLLSGKLSADRPTVRSPQPGEPAFDMKPFAATLATALTARDAMIGVLVLLREAGQPPFTEEDSRRATVFSQQLALALDNARLHAELLRRLEEIARTKDALIFSEKLALTGRIAAGVAHEINNPLVYVLSNLEFVIETADKLAGEVRSRTQEPVPMLRLVDAPKDAETLRALDDIRAAAQDAREGVLRIRHIARDLNAFARPEADSKKPVDMKRVVEWALNVAGAQVRARAQLVKDIRDVAAVLGNETRLGQVVVNLLVNAGQAMPADRESDRNRVTLTLKQELDAVIIEVADTGGGIPAEQIEQIFEPFFTTKPQGVGTGLGLSICRSIIQAHNGQMHVESTPGQGSLFRVTLPVTLLRAVPDDSEGAGDAERRQDR